MGQPTLPILLARIPLDDEVHRLALTGLVVEFQNDIDVLNRVITAIQSNQYRQWRDIPGMLERIG
jgi:hypothetical protein